MKIRLMVLVAVMLGLSGISHAQGYNQDNVTLGNYLKRMYMNAPFEGVRLVEDYDNCYLISVVTLEKAKYGSPSALNRVASVKAMAQASRYFNGSQITSDLIIRTSEDNNGHSDTEMIEHIREHSAGYVKELEMLTSFQSSEGWTTFIFAKQMEMKH